MNRVAIATIIGFILGASPAVAQVASSANIAPVNKAQAGPEGKARRDALFAKMMRDPTDLDAAFDYAALASQAGDIEGAIATLERMLIYAPGLPRLQLELGVLYYRLSAYDRARSYFDEVLSASNVPTPVRLRVETYIKAINERDVIDDLSGSVTFGARYQSNANAAPQDESIRTTLFTDPLLLDPSAMADEDFNGFVASSWRYTHDLQAQGDRLEATLQTYGALYATHDEINTGAAELHLGPVFNLNRFDIEGASLSIYGIIGGVMLKNDPYLYSAGVGTALSKDLDITTRLSLTGEYRREIYNDTSLRPSATDRNGSRYTFSAEMQHILSPTLTFVWALGYERRETRSDYLSYDEGSLGLGLRYAFAAPIGASDLPWILGLDLGLKHRDFDEPDPLFSATSEEEDTEFSSELSLVIPFENKWSMLTSVGYRDVRSNYDIDDFDNVSAMIGITKRF